MNSSEDLVAEDLEENNLERFEEEGNEQNTEEQVPAENEDEAEEAAKQPVKPKRIIRNPRPTLKAETLKGKRGLTALPSYFERVKYKGHGNEEEDLSMILKTYEYWCHRLFPKYPFDDCVKKIESLGSKKAVVTHIKKIRLDMIYDDDAVINDNDDDNNDSATEKVPTDQFDDLLTVESPQPPNELTEEQLDRIRLNKERAENIRKEKLLLQQLGESRSQETTVSESSSSYLDTDSVVQNLLSEQDLPESQAQSQLFGENYDHSNISFDASTLSTQSQSQQNSLQDEQQ